MNRIKFALRMLEVKHQSLKTVSELDNPDSDFMDGYNAGMKAAVKHYGEAIQYLRERLEGYLEEDVDLSGSEFVGGEEHVS